MFLTTILFGVIFFGIVVFVHELGHFVAAKRVGIEVETFSLGWGRKLVGFDYKGTNYRISLIPLGGYCRMKGEDPLHPEETDGKGGFFAAAPWKRVIVSAAGPTANILFAVLVLTVIWWVGFTTYSQSNRIVLASEYNLGVGINGETPASEAGLETGDRIVAVDGRPITNFQDLLETVSTSPQSQIKLTVQRDGQTLSVPIVPELDRQTGAGRIGVYAWNDPVIGPVAKDSAAWRAGLREGDRILSANGTEIHFTVAFAKVLANKPPEVDLRYERQGKRYSTTLIPVYGEQGTAQLGFEFQLGTYPSPHVGFFGAVARGAEETWQTLVLSVKGIGLLFRGINLRNAVVGPLRIVYYAGSVATQGLSLGIGQAAVNYFRFLSLVSVVLFMVNLLPIPALDGGQILVFLVEIIRRRPVNREVIARIQTIGFSVIILLAVVVTFNDLLFFVGR
jgi:regulator of sigma E protease